MKVLQINAVYNILSTGSICAEIHNYLTKNGVECLTVYGNMRGEYTDTIFLGNIIARKQHALMSRVKGKIGYSSKKQTKKLCNIIANFKPDVVHLHNLHANFVNIPMLLEYLGENDIPTVVTLHDCFFYTGGCTHYTVNNCFKWQKQCEKCEFNDNSWFFDRTKEMFEDKRELFGKIKNLAVIGVSEWITKEARRSPILGQAKFIETIYNGIDLNIFVQRETDFRKKFGLENKKIILGVASGWSDKKGLNIFLELSKLLSDDEIIVLVGRISAKNLSQNIIHIPATDNVSELVEIYNASDVFLQASKEETFGKVVAEALACGTPVITNTYTANPELIDDNCGIILGDFTVDNIYSAVKEIFNKGKEEYKCRERAEEKFDKELSYEKNDSIYKLLVNTDI